MILPPSTEFAVFQAGIPSYATPAEHGRKKRHFAFTESHPQNG